MCNTQMIEYLAPWVEYIVMGTLHSRTMQSSMSMTYKELLSRSANNEEHILWAICNSNIYEGREWKMCWCVCPKVEAYITL